MAINVCTAKDTLGLYETVALGTTGSLRLTQDFLNVDAEVGPLRVTQDFLNVDAEVGPLRVTQLAVMLDGTFPIPIRATQEVLSVDFTGGVRRATQQIISVDMTGGVPRATQLVISVDVPYWGHVCRDTLPLYDTVVSTRIAAEVALTYTRQASDSLPLYDTVVSTRILSVEGGPTTYTYQITDTLDLDDREQTSRILRIRDAVPVTDALYRDSDVPGVWARAVRDTLGISDRRIVTRQRNRTQHDWITITDTVRLQDFYCVGMGVVEVTGEGSPWYTPHYDGFGGVEVSGYGDTWRDFAYEGMGRVEVSGPALYRIVELTITGVPDGWSARVVMPDTFVAAENVASQGTVTLPMMVVGEMTSGHLQVYTDGLTYTRPAPYGLTQDGDLYRGNVWAYSHRPWYLTADATSAYIDRPYGGWTAPGSLRVDREEIGFTTFTDSVLGGLARGSHGTTATSHTSVVTLASVAIVEASAVRNITPLMKNTNAVRWRQDQSPIFVNSFDELIFGASSRFSMADLWLARNASERLRIYPLYSTGSGTWGSLVASSTLAPLDATSGFTWTGALGIEPPGNWEPTNVLTKGVLLPSPVPLYYMRLVRLSETLAVPPSLMDITLTGETVITKRIVQTYLYYPTLQDSGQTLFFKAVAKSIGGGVAEGANAPVTVVNLG